MTAVEPRELTLAEIALLPADERLPHEKKRFLAMVQSGIPRLHAAIDIGWSPSKLAHLLASKDFNEMVAYAEAYVDDDIEMVLVHKAKDGNMEAIKMWLTNRRPDRWADKREVKHTGEVQVAQVIIDGTREGLRALIEGGDREGLIQAVMPGGSLDEEIADAELVDD